MNIHILIFTALTFFGGSYAVTSYISHIQNYVNLVSAYYQDGYSTIGFPPLADVSHPMMVNIDMHLYAINGFDEVAGNIELVVAMAISWTDEMSIIHSITFRIDDRSEFLVPYDMIWTPKLVLTNAIGDTSGVGDSAYLCRFNMKTKRVTWKPRVVVSGSCTPDVTYYPFDRQQCEFIYTCWGFNADEIMITTTSDAWNQDEYGESGEWNIAGTSTDTYVLSGQSYIRFSLQIVRKPLYFAFNILLPVLVLCLLNSTVFLLPAESGERVGFSVTCFLSFMVLLNMIMDIMPRSSSPISFLCYYLVVMMSNSGGMTLVTILLMRVYHKPEKSTVPKWLQRTVTFLNCGCARLRCCVLCCRAIRDKCNCSDKRKCGCSTQKKSAGDDDTLLEVTVKDNKVIEKPTRKHAPKEKANQSETGVTNKCCCFISCQKLVKSHGHKCCRGNAFGCKKSLSNSDDVEPKESKTKKKIGFFCFGNKIGSLDKVDGSKTAICADPVAAEKSETNSESNNSCLNVWKMISKSTASPDIDAEKPVKSKNNGLASDTKQNPIKSKSDGRDKIFSADSDQTKCFSFLRKNPDVKPDIVDIDNDILPPAKQGEDTGKSPVIFKKSDRETSNEIDLLGAWDSSTSNTTNKKRQDLESIVVDAGKIKIDEDVRKVQFTNDTEVTSQSTAMKVSKKKNESKSEVKEREQNKTHEDTIEMKKPAETHSDDITKSKTIHESMEKKIVKKDVKNETSDKAPKLKDNAKKGSTEKKSNLRDSVKKDDSNNTEDDDADMLEAYKKLRRYSRRQSSIGGKLNKKSLDKALRLESRRRSSVRILDLATDSDSESVESSEVDSLADLEEEVSWADVGRIMDTFFFLAFSGGQAFFTVVFLVPLFTAPTE